jgi:CDP-paratose 2-epimerase
LKVLVTGGCGFLGTNVTDALLRRGADVHVLDNLARAGSERNLEWLERHPGADRLETTRAGVDDADAVAAAVTGADVVIHMAAQVAVTASTDDPRRDFEINALGTLNVLEAARASAKRPPVLYSSTNKVYGGMEDVRVEEGDDRYRYSDRPSGTPESQPLDFHSPYGCSKGAADQYVRDYARVYGLPTVVFRTSCVYGPHQFGNEDQGWIAHFLISAMQGRPVTIYGDGKQVRDVLHADDAVRAYLAAIERIDAVSGEVMNLGGGPGHTLSLLELLAELERLLGRPVETRFDDWRTGDQRVYVSDIRKIGKLLDWRPEVGVQEGIRSLARWIEQEAAFAVLPRPETAAI